MNRALSCRGKETMICQLLHKPQKDAGKRIVEDTSQIELLDIPQSGRVLHRGRRRHCQLLQKGGCA